MAKRCFLAMAVVFLMILMTVSAWAVPTSMNYQGMLTDSDGNALTGTYNMTFYLFTTPSDGSAIWSENHPSVQVTDGIYNVQLGGLTPSLFENDELYLEVDVEGETLVPRQQLTSTAFSMRAATAEDAETLDGKDSSEFADSGHDHPFGEITGTATDSQVPDDITINNAATADYAASADSADYATSAGDADTVDGQHASAFAEDSEIMPTVLANDGSGSGLDADKLDGQEASDFATSGHAHDHGAMTGLGDDDHSQYFHRSQNETITGRPAFNGGTSGSSPPFNVDSTYRVSSLNADMLDGYDSSSFAGSSHSHDNRYFTEGESDSRFVNSTGDTMSGSIAWPSALLTVTNNGTGNGIEVSNAGFHGVSVSNPTYDGVYVSNATDDGVQVDYAGDDGVYVYGADNDGVVVESAGRDGVSVYDTTLEGVYVSNAGRDGVYVYDTTSRGIVVYHAGSDGVEVSNATYDGVRVDYAGEDGVEVNSADNNGVRITSAGRHGAYIYDPSVNGVEIYSPGYDGVYISNAPRDGVRVSAADDGVQVSGAAYGLNATDMTTFGVYATGGTGAYFRDTGSGTYAYIAWGDYGIYSNGTKNFVQEHPTQPDQVIVYASLEGGEAGTYYRGTAQLTNGTATIELPEHFTLVTEEEGLTVQVTPRADCNGLYVAKVDTSSIVVMELQGGTSNARFDFLVNGIRSGYADYKAINSKSELGLDEMEEAQREKEQKDAEQRAEREREREREQKQWQERELERHQRLEERSRKVNKTG